MVDSFSRMIAGVVFKDKKAETILEKLEMEWCLRYGYLSIGFYADNRGEFRNHNMEELVSKLVSEFSPSYSPWSNGLNERNHYITNRIVKKLMDEKKDISLEEAVSRASWTHFLQSSSFSSYSDQ